jgi:ankyrin repeat protein
MTRLSLAVVMIGLTAALPAAAQTAPSTGEIAAYSGLFDAAHRGTAAEITRLIAAGAGPNARDRRRRTPFLVAAHARNHAAMRALAMAGADINAQDEDGYGAVTIAAVANDPETMSLALELGARPDQIHWKWHGTALIAASELGHAEVVRRLIAAGTPLDHVNKLGWTALIEAVVLGDGGPAHQDVVRALVTAGADISIADREGMTPSMLAEERGFDDIAAIIRAGG